MQTFSLIYIIRTTIVRYVVDYSTMPEKTSSNLIALKNNLQPTVHLSLKFMTT